jgi:hypothetical protein
MCETTLATAYPLHHRISPHYRLKTYLKYPSFALIVQSQTPSQSTSVTIHTSTPRHSRPIISIPSSYPSSLIFSVGLYILPVLPPYRINQAPPKKKKKGRTMPALTPYPLRSLPLDTDQFVLVNRRSNTHPNANIDRIFFPSFGKLRSVASSPLSQQLQNLLLGLYSLFFRGVQGL